MATRRLLLLGGGHAHVQVVRAFAAARPADAQLVLLSDQRLTPYSGMLPGLIAGHYTHAAAHIDLRALCDAAEVTFVEERACGIDPDRQRVETTAGRTHAYDILSIDTGSVPPVDRIPGAAAHAVPIKPVGTFFAALEDLDANARAGRVRSIAVVGGGAAGFEVVMALEHRLRSRLGAHSLPSLHVYTDAPGILGEMPAAARRYAMRALERRHVEAHTGRRVAEITAAGVRLEDGSLREAHPVFLVTGASPSPIYREGGLATDERGFIAVHPTLQSTSHPRIFACGDIASVIEHPRPKAGVFAVRQGPPLTRNLRRALNGDPLQPFVPQREYLVLLSTGGKHAIATRNGLAVQGRWVWHWKDHIDRGFVNGFAPQAVSTHAA